MAVDRSDLDQFEELADTDEFNLPPDDKSSYTRLHRIVRPWRGSNRNLAFPIKPSRIAQDKLMEVVTAISNVTGLSHQEVDRMCYLNGVYWAASHLLNGTDALRRMREAYFIELKAADREDVYKAARHARDVLDDREFAIYCKPRGLNPEAFNETEPKPRNTKTEIMLWAYELYTAKTQFKINHAIQDAVDNAVIENTPKGKSYIKTLMSEWGVSGGGQRGVWDFRGLNDNIVAECKQRELVDGLT